MLQDQVLTEPPPRGWCCPPMPMPATEVVRHWAHYSPEWIWLVEGLCAQNTNFLDKWEKSWMSQKLSCTGRWLFWKLIASASFYVCWFIRLRDPIKIVSKSQLDFNACPSFVLLNRRKNLVQILFNFLIKSPIFNGIIWSWCHKVKINFWGKKKKLFSFLTCFITTRT